MNRIAVLVWVSVLVGCAGSAAPVATSEEVEAVPRAFYAAVEVSDFGTLQRMTTPTVEIIDAGRRMNLAEFEAFLGEVSAQGVVLDFTHSAFNTVIHDDLAYLSFHSLNQSVDQGFYESMVLVRRDGAWLIDRFHSTPQR